MNDELKHYGVKGMKWGVRRYQNEDGTLTEKGKKHYATKGYAQDAYNSNKTAAGKAYDKYTGAHKNAGKMIYDLSSDEENTARAKKYLRDKERAATKGWSKDAKRARNLQKKSVKSLSNKEIREVNNRKQLEKQYRDLNPSNIEVGMKTAAAIGASMGTIYTLYQNADKLMKLGKKFARVAVK